MANIDLITYAGSLVTPQDDAMIQHLFTPGDKGIIYGCAASISGNNALYIDGGFGIAYGREFKITPHTVSVELPAASEPGRVYVKIDLANASNPIEIVAEHGANLPTLTDTENINIVSGTAYVMLATFTASAAGLSEITDARPMTSKIIPVTRGGTGVDGSNIAPNRVLASPNGKAGAVGFRVLVADDIPNLAASKITSGLLSPSRGGTGASGANLAANRVLASPAEGSGAVGYRALVAADIPGLPASKITSGTLPVSRGGTGQSSVDYSPTPGSEKMVTSGGIFNAINPSGGNKVKSAKRTARATALTTGWTTLQYTDAVMSDLVTVAANGTISFLDNGIYALSFDLATSGTGYLWTQIKPSSGAGFSKNVKYLQGNGRPTNLIAIFYVTSAPYDIVIQASASSNDSLTLDSGGTLYIMQVRPFA